MKKNLSIILTSMFFAFSYNCKADIVEKAQTAKKRILLVITEEAESNPKVADFNATLKKVLSKWWTFNDSILYMPRTEAEKIKESQTDKYFIIEFFATAIGGNKNRYQPFEKIEKGFPDKNQIVYYLSEKPPFKNAIYESHCNYYSRDEATLTFKFKNAQTVFYSMINDRFKKGESYYYMVNKDNELLSKKTLLIDTALFADLSDTSKIKEYYNYPYKISNQKEINNAILNASSEYAFIEISSLNKYSTGLFITHHIYDTKDCLMLSYSPRGYQQGFETKLNPKNFKFYMTQ